MLFTRPKARVWAWDWRSAVPSSKRMGENFGQAQIPRAALSFNLRCRFAVSSPRSLSSFDAAEQIGQSSVVLIANWRLAIRLDPFGMLHPERSANQRSELSITTDFFGHDDTNVKGLGVRASSNLDRSGVVMEFRCCKRLPNSAAGISRSAPNALPHRSPFSHFRSLSVLCRQ